MARFMYIYSGGDYPDEPEEMQAIMAEWEAWMEALGDKLVDGGSPLGEKRLVAGAEDSGANGYSIVEAGNLAEAEVLCNQHPHIKHGGAIEIAAFVEM